MAIKIISATGHPIHFMFGSRVGFFGDGGSNVAISTNDVYGLFTLPSETTSHRINVFA